MKAQEVRPWWLLSPRCWWRVRRMDFPEHTNERVSHRSAKSTRPVRQPFAPLSLRVLPTPSGSWGEKTEPQELKWPLRSLGQWAAEPGREEPGPGRTQARWPLREGPRPALGVARVAVAWASRGTCSPDIPHRPSVAGPRLAGTAGGGGERSWHLSSVRWTPTLSPAGAAWAQACDILWGWPTCAAQGRFSQPTSF